MTTDLFSAGFAWDGVAADATPAATASLERSSTPDSDPSHAAATGDATANSRAFSGDFGWNDGTVASVASVAEQAKPDDGVAMSQPSRATPVATPGTADFCGVGGEFQSPVASVASVANWNEAIATPRDGAPPDGLSRLAWRCLISDARMLVANWGADLVAAGWSTLDVFGSNPDPRARRLDRVGLCLFLKGHAVEAIDTHTALIRVSATDAHTFDRRLIATGGVPFWCWVDGSSGRQPGQGVRGSAFRAYPDPPAPVNRLEDSGERFERMG